MSDEYDWAAVAAGIDAPAKSAKAPPGFSVEELKKEAEKARKMASQTPAEIKMDEDTFSSTDALAAVQLWGESAAFGWADEIGLALAAGTVSLFTGEDAGEVMFKMKEAYDKRQADLKEDYPGVALAAEVGGALASPVNFISGPAALTARLNQIAGIGGTAARTGAAVGRGAVEGAVYEAGMSDDWQQGLQEGGFAGGVGAGIAKGAFGALGAGFNRLTRPKFDELVDESGNFMPITLADYDPTDLYQSSLRTFLRDIVAPGFGSKGIIQSQEKVVLDGLQETLEQNKAIKEGLEISAKRVQKNFDESLEALNKTADEQIKNIPAEDFTKRLAALEEGGKESKKILAEASKRVQQQIDSERFVFRQQAILEAMPPQASSKDIEKILAMDLMQDKMAAMGDLWSAVGFRSMDGKKFRLSKLDLETAMRREFKNASVTGSEEIINTVMRTFDDKLLTGSTPTTLFRGEDVSSFRSVLGTKTGSVSDNPELFRGMLIAQEVLDQKIRAQMPKSSIRQWDADKAAWRVNTVLKRAALDSMADGKKMGNFTEDDWMRSIKANTKKDLLVGSGPLNEGARKLQLRLGAMERRAARKGAEAARKKALKIQAEIASQAKILNRKKAVLEKRRAAAEKNLRNDPYGPERLGGINKQISDLQAEIARRESQLKGLNDIKSSPHPGWFYTFAATGALLGLTGTMGPSGAAIGAGLLGAARLSTRPGVQRALAGQADWQKAAQEAMARESTKNAARTAEILAGRGVTTGMLIGERD